MRIDDFARLKLSSSPQISPDGKHVLFVLNTVDRTNDDYQEQLCITPSRGGGGKVRRLQLKSHRPQSPSWSPDGKRILFVTGNAGQKSMRLCVFDVARNRTNVLCEMPNSVERPFWSPDGTKVLFLSRIKVDKEQIDNKGDVKIVKHLWYKFTTTGWFHDTRKHVFVIDSRGGKKKPRQVTDGEFDVAAAYWMPDSIHLVFSANQTEEETDSSIYKDIWMTSSSGSNRKKESQRKVTTSGKWQIDAVSVIPKDSTILFVGREIPDESYVIQKKSNIWAIRGGEGQPVNLTKDFDQWVVPFHSCVPGWSDDPKFSADGSKVYFMAYENGAAHVFQVVVEDQTVQRVTQGKITVSAFSVGAGGEIAYVSTDSSHAQEVWMKRPGEQAIRLTNFNDNLASPSNFSQPEEFWFETSDGRQVQGWMIRPTGFQDDGRKYPTLLSIHGGPYSAYTYGLTGVEHEFQVYAAAGFAVFYTNPRGSLGFGEKFTEEISGHYAERDYADVMESVDYVTKKFAFVDQDRMGVFGGSYGGFMTNWVISHSDRFKVAVSDRCVSNWYSFAGVFDLAGFQWLPYHEIGHGKGPWEVPELYLEKSPIHHIKNINTPVLFIHSDADWSTALDNAEQMFVGLKRLKKEAKLVIFPGENHFLSWTGKPSHRAERLRHYVLWFVDHLQPEK